MTPARLVRELTAGEREAPRRGLRSADGFAARRSQVLLASAGGAGPAAIGTAVGLSAQAVRNAVRAFRASGLGCPARRPPVARVPAAVWDRGRDDDLKALLHVPPRTLGKPTGLRTLALAAEVCHARGWTSRAMSAGGIRLVLKRLGVGRERARHGITSPDPEYAERRRPGTTGSPRPPAGPAGWSGSRASAGGPGSPSRPRRAGPRAIRSGRGRAPATRRGGGPEAVACYGVLRADTGGMMLRFCDGRPVGPTTGDFLGWVCRELAAEGEAVLALTWDSAAWHVSKRVRAWIAAHDERVGRDGGCRIEASDLPVKAPWPNAIEPKWVHGKRAVAEPDRKLSADELRQRACECYGCRPEPLLAKPAT